MGVPGLWDIIQHTAETRSLSHLAVVDGFEKNTSGLRGYRIGIDASIWFFHAKSGREGENPELRLIFFRLAKLLSEPFLPLFVFDGPKRPSWKRGIQISKKPHWMIHGVKTMIKAFGFEWIQAPGEAEAELAYLNRAGVIDGILSDDVDNFLFGALTVIRNPGKGLTGNLANPALNKEGKDDGNHVRIFRSSTIAADPKAGLNRAGFILIGLLSGGDYEEKDVPGSKLNGCGPATAHALARCGFGEELVNAFQVLSPDEFTDYLVSWRDALRAELRSNSRGLLGRKQGKLASSIPETFPNLAVLAAYIRPVTSESDFVVHGRTPIVPDVQWKEEHSLAALARFCEDKFEWGTREIIPKRFRSLMWHGSVVRILRRAQLDRDRGEGHAWRSGHVRSTERPMRSRSETPNAPQTPKKKRSGAAAASSLAVVADGTTIGTPSKMLARYFSDVSLRSPTKLGPSSSSSPSPDDDDDDDDAEHALISSIASSTTSHPQTDNMLEYRIEIDPYQLIKLTQSGIVGTREEPSAASDFDSGDDEEEGGKKKKKGGGKKVDKWSMHRMWVPASMLEPVEPELVGAFEDAKAAKEAKKGGRKKAASTDGLSSTLPTAKAPSSSSGRTSTRPGLSKVSKSAPAASSRSRSKTANSSSKPKRATSALTDEDEDDAEGFDLGAVSDASAGSSDDDDRVPAPPVTRPPLPVKSRTAPSASTSAATKKKPNPIDEIDSFFSPAKLTTKPKVTSTSASAKEVSTSSSSRAPSSSSIHIQHHASTSTSTSSSSLSKPKAIPKPKTSKPPPPRSRAVLDEDDWDDLFPTTASPPRSRVRSAAASLSSSPPPPAVACKRPTTITSMKSNTKNRSSSALTDSEEEDEWFDLGIGIERGHISKSPRKTKEHSSPSHQGRGRGSQPAGPSSSSARVRALPSRSPSPTPRKPPPKTASKTAVVLSISSGSESEDDDIVPPSELFSLAAAMRAKRKIPSASAAAPITASGDSKPKFGAGSRAAKPASSSRSAGGSSSGSGLMQTKLGMPVIKSGAGGTKLKSRPELAPTTESSAVLDIIDLTTP